MTRVIAALLLAVLLGSSLAHCQHRLNIINAESGLSEADLRREVRKAIRTLRRQTRKPYRIARYREIEDDSPGALVQIRIAHMWFKVPTRARHTTVVFYNSRGGPAYGVASICYPFAMLSYPDNAPALWVKFVLAHELGHTLGAGHDADAYPLTLMYPFWDRFLEHNGRGAALFEFSEYSLGEMRKCRRFSLPGEWEF